MGMIPYIGKCFPTLDGFLGYLYGIKFGQWHPDYITAHHTGSPDLKTWNGWQTRTKPVSDEQWMTNLAGYYGSPAFDAKGRKIKDAWSSGPQFFFTPKNYCVLSHPDRPGVHAVSFNRNSWGVEMVGNFDSEKLEGNLLNRYVEGLAALHIAAHLAPTPYKIKKSGLHFHRDDPTTSKTCPGKSVSKDALVKLVRAKMDAMTGQEAPHEKIVAVIVSARNGTVKVPAGDTLNVRASASGKAPIVEVLQPGAAVSILGEATNDKTKWLRIDLPGNDDGWVAERFIA